MLRKNRSLRCFARDFRHMTQVPTVVTNNPSSKVACCQAALPREEQGLPAFQSLLCQMHEIQGPSYHVHLPGQVPKIPLVKPPAQLGKLRAASVKRGAGEQRQRAAVEEGVWGVSILQGARPFLPIMVHFLLKGTAGREFLLMKITYTWHRKQKQLLNLPQKNLVVTE